MTHALMVATLIWSSPLLRAAADPFDRASCAEYILGNGGARLKGERLGWLRAHAPIVLGPSNQRPEPFPFEDMDEYFVAHRARSETPAVRSAMVRGARDLFESISTTPPRTPAPSTALTPLQARALGVLRPSETPVDQLTTYLVFRSEGVVGLDTYDGPDPIGGVSLDANAARVGYRGNPEYWVYRETDKDVGDRRDLKPASFLDEHALLAFRVNHAGRDFIYTVHAYEAGDERPWTAVNVEVFLTRPVHPALTEEDVLQIPPDRDPPGPTERLTPVGLRLDRVLPTDGT